MTVNCRSLRSEEKQNQLLGLITDHEPDIIFTVHIRHQRSPQNCTQLKEMTGKRAREEYL